MLTVMRFPEKPTVHGTQSPVSGYPAIWRPPFADRGETFRTCFYCGSIHPEDLLKALDAGGKLGGSDWKYGWPHKFYVDVPNPEPDRLFEMGGETRWTDNPCPRCCDAAGAVKPEYASPEVDRCGSCYGHRKERVHTPHMSTRETLHAKWYNEHLQDEGYDPEAFDAVVVALEKHAGIRFDLVPDPKIPEQTTLQWRAPRYGYQRD
jgi:hypothetical protein